MRAISASRGRFTSCGSRLGLWVVLLALVLAATTWTPTTLAQTARYKSVKETSNASSSSHTTAPSNQTPAAVAAATTTAAAAAAHPNSVNAVTLAIRGGAASILLFPVNLVKSYVADHTFGSFLQTHFVMIAKGTVIVFITASIMAYLGVIGDHDHHFQDWVVEHENKLLTQIRKWGFHPRGFLRTKLQGMLNNFRNMPPRPKFASAVSLGTTAFPLVVQTVNWTVRIVLAGFLAAEVLALLGVLGKPGEGLEKWVEEGGSEPIVRILQRGVDEARTVLRQKLQVQEILNNFIDSLRKDDIYWMGFAVGAAASMIIKDK